MGEAGMTNNNQDLPIEDNRRLQIYYDSTTDTLSLWNGVPANNGERIAGCLTIETTNEGEATGITLEYAAKLLRPYLFPDTPPKVDGEATQGKPDSIRQKSH
jgi:uncharacterized protein YuzE